MNVDDFLAWAKIKEKSLTDSSDTELTLYYNESVEDSGGFRLYLGTLYTRYVYNKALHNAIVGSVYTPALDVSYTDDTTDSDTSELASNGFELTSLAGQLGESDEFDDVNNSDYTNSIDDDNQQDVGVGDDDNNNATTDNASGDVDTDDNNDNDTSSDSSTTTTTTPTTTTSPTELETLYVKYGVYNYTSSIMTSTSGAGTSGSGQLPNVILNSGTVDTNERLSTPYGRFVEQAEQATPSVV